MLRVITPRGRGTQGSSSWRDEIGSKGLSYIEAWNSNYLMQTFTRECYTTKLLTKEREVIWKQDKRPLCRQEGTQAVDH